MQVDVKKIEMKGVEKKYILGIITDEDAMLDLLAKYLSKEGYEVKRVFHEIVDQENFDLVILASSRYSDHSKKFFKNLRTRKLIIVQSADEDFSGHDDDTVVLSDRPLNLKKLSETIGNILAKHDYAETAH